MVAIVILISSHQFSANSVRGAAFQYCSNHFLNCLGCWDSGWYLNVAKNGYTFLSSCQDQTAFGFFPLYPMAMRLLGAVIGDQFIAGIIISNLLLFIASFFLFLLSDRICQNKKTAMLSVLILYFFPGSYLLSGVFSESAFICFSVMCFYYFETDDYALCGISGFFLTLTRPFGVLILLPLCLRYMQRNGLQFRLRSLFLLLIPMGILSFFAYCYFMTGDFLFYVHAKQLGWNNNYV
jgi:Gpi18-like mannosyltransferase